MENTCNGPQPNNKDKPELADIFRLYGEEYRRSHSVSYEQIKAMHHIKVCRTSELEVKEGLKETKRGETKRGTVTY